MDIQRGICQMVFLQGKQLKNKGAMQKGVKPPHSIEGITGPLNVRILADHRSGLADDLDQVGHFMDPAEPVDLTSDPALIVEVIRLVRNRLGVFDGSLKRPDCLICWALIHIPSGASFMVKKGPQERRFTLGNNPIRARCL
jgi:hypothetical protein